MNKLRRLFGQPINIGKRVVLLGMDGLDPELLREKMDRGELPNFKKLASQGGFSPLKTTWMPLSPVAWSSFISGSNPGKHGIFDFLHRDPEEYAPHLSIARQGEPEKTLDVGPFTFPLEPSSTDKGRQGPSFWTESSRQGVRTDVIRCPVSFPPEPVRGKMLSGLGVPDLKGTQGEFTFYTSNVNANRDSRGGTIKIIDHPKVEPIEEFIDGPANPFYSDQRTSTVPMTLRTDGKTLDIELPEITISLKEDEWSDWIPLDFNFLGPLGAEGQVRFYLNKLSPEFELYCSPVNASPNDPAFPISYPDGFSEQLADTIGRFHTLGLTADTGMLKEGRVDDVTFLEQTNTVLNEREAMLKEQLSNFDDGVFNFVFDIPDRIQHMFWRYRDPDHPLYEADKADVFGDVIDRNYERMDNVLGWVMEELHDEDDLVVVSDHGFTSFRRQVDLNRWLYEEGYLHLEADTSPEDVDQLFRGVNWKKTSAYAIGLAGIYINRTDREAEGSVPPDQVKSLEEELAEKLTALRDPKGNEPVVSRVGRASETYGGNATADAPDLLIGYHRQYRISWDSAMGGIQKQVFSDNTNPWSGDHCVDPELIPGSLLANFEFDVNSDVGLWDVVPGVFSRLGLEIPEEMDGSDHWL